MNNNNNMIVPIIGGKRTMPIEPFHIDGLGWFKPNDKMTGEHVAHILIMIVTLMMPRDQRIALEVDKYAEKHDLAQFFDDVKPETAKELDALAKSKLI